MSQIKHSQISIGVYLKNIIELRSTASFTSNYSLDFFSSFFKIKSSYHYLPLSQNSTILPNQTSSPNNSIPSFPDISITSLLPRCYVLYPLTRLLHFNHVDIALKPVKHFVIFFFSLYPWRKFNFQFFRLTCEQEPLKQATKKHSKYFSHFFFVFKNNLIFINWNCWENI